MNTDFEAFVSPALPEEERAIHRVADAVHRVNEAIRRAVDAGVSVELMRGSRHHDRTGNWGDQMVPLVRKEKPAKMENKPA